MKKRFKLEWTASGHRLMGKTFGFGLELDPGTAGVWAVSNILRYILKEEK